MRKSKKIAIIVSLLCILIGAAIMLVAWLSLRDMEPGLMQFEENTHTITDSFDQIYINTLNSTVEILPSGDGTCRIVCDDNEKRYHEVSIRETEDGTALSIIQHDEWKWYETLGGVYWNHDPELTVYLPETVYGSLEVVSIGGNVTVAPDFRFQNTRISSTSGNIVLTKLSADQLGVYSISGDIVLRSVQAEADIYLENVSGFTQAENVTAATLALGTNSGDNVLDSVSSEQLNITSVSGNVTVINGNISSDTYIETSSGNVEITDSVCAGQSLSTNSGNLALHSVRFDTLALDTTSGCAELFDVISKESIILQSVSGELLFSGMDAQHIEIISSSGSVSGSLLTPKEFITETASGYVEVPPSDEDAGLCFISTASGDIIINMQS